MAKHVEMAEMPFLDHLEELRWRIIWSLIALAVGIGVAFAVLLKFDIVLLLERPIAPYLNGHKLVYTHPGDPFSIYMTMSFSIGIFLALPVIVYQLWLFVSPALFKHEKRMVIPVILGAVFLFVSGVALSFFVVLPLAIPWLMGFQTASLEPMITASEYFGLAVSMSLAFGLCFELPIVILALAALGIVTPKFLNTYRRHAIVLCVIVGAFLTPGDLVWTTIAMAVPLYLLYEASVILTYGIERRRKKRLAQLSVEEDELRAPKSLA
ncbi:MAG: twin-arginine translocase subunit TatC [Gemmatimonadota bacterium]|nr:twin-arginine translocase subunit TatC [Gemmatimonadota bacterium]